MSAQAPPSRSAYADQESNNKLILNDIHSKLAAATLNATRSLGDVKRDKAVDLTLQHTDAVAHAVHKLNWSEFAVGHYGLADIHSQLRLEIPLTELTTSGKRPQFDELLKLLDALDALLNDASVFLGVYRPVVEDTRRLLEEQREKFRDSQVNIDELDHAPMMRLLDVLKQCVLSSVESLVEKMDDQQMKLEQQHAATLKAYLDTFAAEARIVESATAARLRASRPEDDLDPWQAPPATTEPVFDSPVAQRWYEREQRMKVSQEYDAEWLQKHRDEVATLLPRANRVALEDGVDAYFAPLLKTVEDIYAVCEERVRIIVEREQQHKAEMDAIVGGIRKERELLIAEGDRFQAKKRAQREASERDLVKVREFRALQEKGSAELTAEYEANRDHALRWLKENELDIQQRMQEIIRLQESVVELTQSRRQVVDSVIAACEAESKRLSRQRVFVELSDQYDAALQQSMKDFLLPEGYSGLLVGFATRCQDLAQSGFDAQAQSLQSLLRTALTQLRASALSQSAAIPPLVYRKQLKSDDLKAKAHTARLQREFCAATNDPYRSRHENTERDILALDAAIEASLPQLRDKQREFDRKLLVDVNTTLQQHGGASIAVNDQWFQKSLDTLVQTAHPFLMRGSRAPLTTLLSATKRSSDGADAPDDGFPAVVVPGVYYDSWMVQRADAASRAERVFK